jgi:hypothetical protein
MSVTRNACVRSPSTSATGAGRIGIGTSVGSSSSSHAFAAPGSRMASVSIIRPPTWQSWGHQRVRVGSVVVDEQD